MGKKRQKKDQEHQQLNPNATEAIRIKISRILEEFRAAKDEVYTFDADLSAQERAVAHEVSRKMGMKSKSSGRGKQRRLSVYKAKNKVDTNKGKESISLFTFSEKAKVVLQDLFTHFPPVDGEGGEKIFGRHGEKTDKMQKSGDDIFSKPSMNKSEIAKKMESLTSRREKATNMRQIIEKRLNLPIASFKDVITSTVESNQVVIISGETGCGKTTQVPQFLLDHIWGKGEACKIVCTQPRRISAVSVAERISYERGETIGDNIGYKIRLESKGGRNSSIVFCTNGILLRVLVSNGAGRLKEKASNNIGRDDISAITHIIMDEIHERDCYADFMLTILRDMLPSYPHLRLIAMSATLDADRLSQYFGGCPVIRVPGFTYPVKTFYLEDVLSILKFDENHLDSAISGVPNECLELAEEDKNEIDEAIDLAWSNDEFDLLLELVSFEGAQKFFNYQHSSSGLTPLMVFAGKGRVDDVSRLLASDVDCHLKAKYGRTALELAERENQLEVAQIIRRHLEAVLSESTKQQLLDKYLAKINPELIDLVLIEQLLKKLCTDSDDGAILVFLPGWEDINRTRERLLMNSSFNDASKFVIISLHSMVPSVEQKKVFTRPAPGCRKIVLSTNIAESSITIDDVVYVIDSGRMKEKNYDPYNNVSTLQTAWVSKASAKQREGRAGRCQPGICYHLYSKLRADSLPDFQIPEIKRMPIEELCLQVKLLDPDCKIEEFLQKVLDPPVSQTICNAITVLQDIGALSADEKITSLGEQLGRLPVHPLMSKMLLFAILMNCLDPALTLACASDYRDPFTLPLLPGERKKAAVAKFQFASLYGGQSDQLAVMAAFECWKNARHRGQEARFCSKYFVSSSTMNMLLGMRDQLLKELIRNGFVPRDISSCNLNSLSPGVLHAVLVAGLYPMVARLRPPHKNGKRFVETASGAKVRLHPLSINFRLSSSKSDECPLIVYDEITRGDGGMHIRNCSVVGPLPLLLLATEIAVAPAKDCDDDGYDEGHDDYTDEDVSEEDATETDNSKPGHVMSSPDNSVVVVVDRWLSVRTVALDVAQIYCLRERLSAAVLFKVTHPHKALPPVLGASMYAIAHILSADGLSDQSLAAEPVDSLASMIQATEIDKKSKPKGVCQTPSKFLISLMSQNTMPVDEGVPMRPVDVGVPMRPVDVGAPMRPMDVGAPTRPVGKTPPKDRSYGHKGCSSKRRRGSRSK